MEMIKHARWTLEDSWLAVFASLLPLWLLASAVTAEGFPKPPISPELAIIAAIFALVLSIVLLWMGWLEVDIVLYSLFPFILAFMFEEISTSYKSFFILLCALILSIGVVGAKRSSSLTVRWLILLLLAVTVWLLASHAAQGYWQMVDGLGFPFECMPDSPDCPLPGDLSPWWVLFFRP
jgi:hypothetical protein